jgi:addiction module HigA family antidote
MTRTPVHPGEILADELESLDLSSAELARTLDVPANRISQIIAGKRSITADTALRLGRYFRSSADLWMNLQKIYDSDLAAKALGTALNKIPQRPVEPTGARA